MKAAYWSIFNRECLEISRFKFIVFRELSKFASLSTNHLQTKSVLMNPGGRFEFPPGISLQGISAAKRSALLTGS